MLEIIPKGCLLFEHEHQATARHSSSCVSQGLKFNICLWKDAYEELCLRSTVWIFFLFQSEINKMCHLLRTWEVSANINLVWTNIKQVWTNIKQVWQDFKTKSVYLFNVIESNKKWEKENILLVPKILEYYIRYYILKEWLYLNLIISPSSASVCIGYIW